MRPVFLFHSKSMGDGGRVGDRVGHRRRLRRPSFGLLAHCLFQTKTRHFCAQTLTFPPPQSGCGHADHLSNLAAPRYPVAQVSGTRLNPALLPLRAPHSPNRQAAICRGIPIDCRGSGRVRNQSLSMGFPRGGTHPTCGSALPASGALRGDTLYPITVLQWRILGFCKVTPTPPTRRLWAETPTKSFT